MFKSVWKLTPVLALVAFATVSAEADDDERAARAARTVDCPEDSIQDAVNRSRARRPLTITVKGTCTEEVVITTDGVTVQGRSIGDEVVGGFTIDGAQRVTIKHLTIRDGTIGYPVGVQASRGAAVVLDDLVITGQGGTGIFLSRNAYADIFGSTVESPPGADNALGLSDGAVVRAIDSTFSSENGAPGNGAAVGLFRSSSARFDGDNFFENTGGGLAIEIQHTSNLRVQNGANFASGNVAIGNNSAANLREVNVGGDITLDGDSNLSLRARSPVVVDGSVTINDQSLLSTSGGFANLSILGGVTCTGGAAGGVKNPAPILGGVPGTSCTVFP